MSETAVFGLIDCLYISFWNNNTIIKYTNMIP